MLATPCVFHGTQITKDSIFSEARVRYLVFDAFSILFYSKYLIEIDFFLMKMLIRKKFYKVHLNMVQFD